MTEEPNQPNPLLGNEPEKPSLLKKAEECIIQFVQDSKDQKNTGSKISDKLWHELGFDPREHGFWNLKDFITKVVDRLVITGNKGEDVWWSLASSLGQEERERALLEMTATEEILPPADGEDFMSGVVFQNFFSCRNVELSFEGKLTVLVGENAAGKTSILRGISFCSQMLSGRPSAVFANKFDFTRVRATGTQGAMVLEMKSSRGSKLKITSLSSQQGVVHKISTTQPGKSPRDWADFGPVPERDSMRAFWPSGLFYFQANRLAEPSWLSASPRLGFDGAGLPTLLAHFATNSPERLEAVKKGLRELVPQCKNLRQNIRKAPYNGGESSDENKYYLEALIDTHWVPADLLSEGTLLALGILALIHQERPPRLILIDDIDRGLHPQAQLDLVRMLKKITAMEGGPQLIVSTHSSVFLDEVPPESVQVVRNTPEGTKVKKLTDHPLWPEWKESMTAGQFWPYVGEAWVEQS